MRSNINGRPGAPHVPAIPERGNDPMTQADFLAALELELRLRGIAFSRADLLDFVASVWPLAQEDPDAAFWAREFIEAG